MWFLGQYKSVRRPRRPEKTKEDLREALQGFAGQDERTDGYMEITLIVLQTSYPSGPLPCVYSKAKGIAAPAVFSFLMNQLTNLLTVDLTPL